MRWLARLLGPAAALAAAGCGSEPATLIVTLDFVPAFVAAELLEVTGAVVRTPAKETPITVTVSGGRLVASSQAEGGRFKVPVQLVPNKTNVLEVIATDGTGASSAPENVTVTHDDVAPTVVQMTPPRETDAAPTTGDIVVTFSEPIVFQAGAQVSLTTVGATMGGVVSVSADSLRLTFIPEAPRRPNHVYVLHLAGVTDQAGNPAAVSEPACFVTSRQDPQQVFLDAAGDELVLGAPASPADLRSTRLSVTRGILSGVLEFSTARSYDTLAPNNVAAFIELDIDQDSTTGHTSLRDDILLDFGFGASNTKVEYVIGIDPYSLEGPSYVGRWDTTTAFQFFVLEEFTPAVCGRYVGVAANTASFGGDDGNFHLTVAAFNLGAQGATIDASPESGFHTVTFQGSFGAPVARSAIAGRGRGVVGLPLLRPRAAPRR